MNKKTELTEDRLIVEGYDVTDEIMRQLKEERMIGAQAGLKNQIAIAKYNQDNPPKMSDALGEVRLSVDEDLFHEVRISRKIETGDPDYECWDDKNFRDWIWKKFPALRVKNRPINNAFRVQGLKTA